MTVRWWGGAPATDQVADAHLLAAVDAALAGSGAAADLVLTHVDRSAPAARTGVSLRLAGEPADPGATRAALVRGLGGPVLVDPAGDDERSAPARTALREADGGTGGRAVRFPGSAAVSGRVSVGQLLTATAIDAVVGVGVPVGEGDVVDTGSGFLRPQLSGGRLTLLVEPAVGGVLKPVEVEDAARHQCCGGH